MSRTLPPISHDPVTPGFLQALIGAEARMILEVGAHHGWHTKGFLRIFPHATIHAFEPDPRAVAKFRASITDPRAQLHEMAIAAEDGDAVFHVSDGLPPDATPEIRAEYPAGWDQSGSLRAPKTHKSLWPWCAFDRRIDVRVRSLDSWAREQKIGDVDFLWADMQGAEGDLVRGGRETLARTRFLYTEYSDQEIYEGEPSLNELLDLLPDFSVVKLYPGDVLLKRA